MRGQPQCPLPSLHPASRAHAEQPPSVVTLLLLRAGRHARQCRAAEEGPPPDAVEGTLLTQAKRRAGRETSVWPVGRTYGLCGVVVCGFGPRRRQGLSPRAAVSAGGGDPEDVSTEAGLASWAGSRGDAHPGLRGQERCSPARVGESLNH